MSNLITLTMISNELLHLAKDHLDEISPGNYVVKGDFITNDLRNSLEYFSKKYLVSVSNYLLLFKFDKAQYGDYITGDHSYSIASMEVDGIYNYSVYSMILPKDDKYSTLYVHFSKSYIGLLNIEGWINGTK